MANIIVFTVAADGHVNPFLPVIENLNSRGHEITWISGLGYQEKIERTGAIFFPTPEEYDPKGLNFHDFRPIIKELVFEP